MSRDVLEGKVDVLDDAERELERSIRDLFKEARERRRKRRLLGGLSGLVLLSVLAIGLAIGGAGHFFGGPAVTSSHQAPLAQSGLHSSQGQHDQSHPGGTGPPICDKKSVLPSTDPSAEASLLPCYKALTPGLATTTP